MTKQAIPLEIERKWLMPDQPKTLKAVIELVEFAQLKIFQVYREEAEGLVRYRSSMDTALGGKTHYTRTLKKRLSAGVSTEDEQDIDVCDFEAACIAGGPMIVKERYRLGHEGLLIEIDHFQVNADRLKQAFGWRQLVLVEVELPSLEAPCALPAVFANPVEVTGDVAWNNDRVAYKLAGIPYPEGLDQL